MPLGLILVPVVIAGAIVLIFIYYFNKIVVLSNRIDNAWSQIDIQLKKRADLVPNLVNIVKGYAKHEKDAINMVTEARENMMKAGNIKDKIKAGEQLGDALKTIFAIAENYPNLKASDNFKLLQEQLEGIENKIAYSRQFYSDSVMDFNNIISTIPGSWFASMFGKNKTKEYFEADEEERKVVKVEF